MYDPIVKWSGSKRSQAEEIVARLPREIATYYEPFCGGCSVLYRILNTPSVKVERYVASDINIDLIRLWNSIRDYPEELCAGYKDLWSGFNRHGLCEDDYERRKEFFYTIRERYNRLHNPLDFLFLMRTTTNGMPRYNELGEFNNSCHFSRPGINPDKLLEICMGWSRVLKEKNVEFRAMSYEVLKPVSGDFVYADPPYFGTRGMYYGRIDFDTYFKWLTGLRCKWMMSFDGKAGNEDFTYDVPIGLYLRHEYLNSGNSSFRRVIGKDRYAQVHESLYMNYIPDCKKSASLKQAELFKCLLSHLACYRTKKQLEEKSCH